jgi:hypothetical protein
MRAALISCAIVLAAGVAHADHRVATTEDDDTPTAKAADQDHKVVMVNAAAKLGDIGQILRVRQVLSKRGMLVKLPDRLEATLDGSNVLISNLDAIKDAYARSDFSTALRLIDDDQERILREAANRDPIPALAELSQWRGIIAAASDDQDEAVRQFRAAYRFNPAWVIDKRLASPRVRAMAKKAHVEPDERGTLRVSPDPGDARVAIDGGEAKPVAKKLQLPVGVHLVMVTADGRRSYTALVDIRADKVDKLEVALDNEDKLDRAARLVDETVAAPAGKPRLKRTKALAQLTGSDRLLVVEDGSENHLTMRLYDVGARKVSRPLELDSEASSAVIARKVAAALEPDNMVDIDSLTTGESAHEAHWYQHWYVWAGLAAVVGGGIVGYESIHHPPTTLRGF